MSTKFSQTVLGLKADGIIGPNSLSTSKAILKQAGVQFWTYSDERKVIAAAQVKLNEGGFEAGKADGYWGHNTQNAYDAWERKKDGQKPLSISRAAKKGESLGSTDFPRHKDIESFYGKAGSANATTGRVILPVNMVIAWNPEQQIGRFSCHKLIAPSFQKLFDETVKQYGEKDFRRLGLDKFGGCFNNRKMRGGTKKSTHAYGAAIDLDPSNNQLRWNSSKASFAKNEYVPFWNIVNDLGLVSLGQARDFDWMHIQGVRL